MLNLSQFAVYICKSSRGSTCCWSQKSRPLLMFYLLCLFQSLKWQKKCFLTRFKLEFFLLDVVIDELLPISTTFLPHIVSLICWSNQPLTLWALQSLIINTTASSWSCTLIMFLLWQFAFKSSRHLEGGPVSRRSFHTCWELNSASPLTFVCLSNDLEFLPDTCSCARHGYHQKYVRSELSQHNGRFQVLQAGLPAHLLWSDLLAVRHRAGYMGCGDFLPGKGLCEPQYPGATPGGLLCSSPGLQLAVVQLWELSDGDKSWEKPLCGTGQAAACAAIWNLPQVVIVVFFFTTGFRQFFSYSVLSENVGYTFQDIVLLFEWASSFILTRVLYLWAPPIQWFMCMRYIKGI